MAAYKGSSLSDGTPLNVAVYKAYRNAGLSHNQSLAITAEVGRENSFNASTLFGNHTDPARTKSGKRIRNLGMLSWNQGRDNMLEGYLKKNGVMRNGVMDKTQANLNAQAQFSVREMKSKRYAPKLKNFFNNPNGSPDSFARELGQNYVVWAYGQNDIKGSTPGTRVPFNWKANDNRRRGYLNTLSGMLGDKTNYASQPTFQAPSFRPATELIGAKPTFAAPSWQSAETLKGAPVAPSFKPPEWQTGGDINPPSDVQPIGFKPPEWNSAPLEQEVKAPVFKPPEFMPPEQLQTAQQTAMPELEPQEWQT